VRGARPGLLLAQEPGVGPTRRRILTAAALPLLAACTSSRADRPPAPPVTPTPSGATTGAMVPAPSTNAADVDLVRTNAALDAVLAAACGAAVDALVASGAAPALAQQLRTARDHHTQHVAGWRTVLPAGSATPALRDADAQVAAVRDAGSPSAAALLVLALEDAAAATCTRACGLLTGADALAVTAGVGPVQASHAASLRFLLGRPLLPAAFQQVDAALLPDALA